MKIANMAYPLPRAAQKLFLERGVEAFERVRVEDDDAGNPAFVKYTRVTRVFPATKNLGRHHVLLGARMEITVDSKASDHESTTWITDLIPLRIQSAQRNKYLPHQGVRECARRVLQGLTRKHGFLAVETIN